MATVDVKLDDKTELTLPANANDYIYILRQVAGGGFQITDYKIKVRNLIGDALPFTDDLSVPNPTEGTQYYNTTSKTLRYYDGVSWSENAPYRAIVGRINQSGTNNPTTSIGYNRLGVTPAFTRTTTGTYDWDITGEGWDLDKLIFNIENTGSEAFSIRAISSGGIIRITTMNATSGVKIDDRLIDVAFELKVYN